MNFKVLPWLILLIVPMVFAQAPADKLDQLEATYQSNLRERHRLIVQQYLTELRNAQALAPDVASETAFAQEIVRITELGKTAGPISLTQEKPSPLPPSGKKGDRVLTSRGMAMSLDPAEALPAQPAGALHVAIGEASWRLSKIPAGSYDLVVEYVCPAIPGDAQLYLDYAGEKIVRPLRETHTTADMRTYRVMRLAQITLKEDAVDQALVLRATSTSAPWFFVKRIIVAKAH
jgi:hypothetical protein